MSRTSSKVILAGLAGLAAGIAVGVLIAPCKGSKTRKRLKKKLREVEDILRESGLSDKLNDLKSVFTKDSEEKADKEPASETTKPAGL